MAKYICEALPNINRTVRPYSIFILQSEKAVSVSEEGEEKQCPGDDRTDHVVEEDAVHNVVLYQEQISLEKVKDDVRIGNTSLQCFVNINNLCLVCLRREERDHVFMR